MKTTIQKLIDDVKEIESRGIELTSIGVITMLENALKEEKEQIMAAVDEGIKYGEGDLRTFDYPASRYYFFTYNQE